MSAIAGDIVAALAAADSEDVDPGALIFEYTSMVGWVPADLRGPGYRDRIWDNLAPAEAARLDELLSECYDLEDDIRRRIIDRVARAALTFAAEYPDAPRVAR